MKPVQGQIGVLVMAYGAPSSPEQIEAFYTEIRHGRAPSAEQLAALTSRYDAIGGASPMASRTAEQVAEIQKQLDLRAPGRCLCVLGNRYSDPRIEDAVDDLFSREVRGIVGIVLSPHYSRSSVGQYVARATERARELAVSAVFVEHWHDHPVLIEVLAERVTEAFESLVQTGMHAQDQEAAVLLVTAHSLPVRVIDDDDPYLRQLQRTAELVAAGSGFERWEVCWQSAGRTLEPWLGPALLDRLRALPDEKASAIVVCPAGFTSDHLEVLYDLDIEARRVAAEAGLAFARTASLNAEPRICAGLADLAIRRGEEL
jgi:ferrochelatase